VELSDIEAFAMLPDGKVLTSTESGALLVWEGNFIKLRVVRRRGRPCHEGAIFVVILERQEGRFVTAGQDGWVRWWDFSALDAAEVDSDKSLDFELEPTEELFVGDRVCVRHMVRWRDPTDAAKDFYLLQDAGGAVWSLDPAARKAAPLLSVPGGALGGMDAAPSTHFAATAGADGTVRLWDYVARKQLFHARFSAAGHCVRWAPLTACPKGRTLAVGFADGVVRVLYRLPDKWKRLYSFKPHARPVTVLEYSRDGRLLATGSSDGTLFLLHVPLTPDTDAEYTPVGFLDLKSSVTSVAWREDGQALLFTLASGGVGEVDLSGPSALEVDTSKSFEITSLPIRRFAFKPKPALRKRPTQADGATAEGQDAPAAASPDDKTMRATAAGPAAAEDEDEEVEDDLAFSALQVGWRDRMCTSIHALLDPDRCVPFSRRLPPPPRQARYSPSTPGHFLLTLGGKLAGAVYECSFESEYPLAEFPVGLGPKAHQEEGAKAPEVISLRPSASGELLVTGANDGSVGVRALGCPDFFTRAQQHDGDRGQVVAAAASFDEAFLLSAGADGLLVVYNFSKAGVLAEAQARAAAMAKEPPAEARDPEHAFLKEDAEEGSNETLPGFVKCESSTKVRGTWCPSACRHRCFEAGGFMHHASRECVGVMQAAGEMEPDGLSQKREGADIRDPASYSIQDAKLKVGRELLCCSRGRLGADGRAVVWVLVGVRRRRTTCARRRS
jgi:WD40 repeat protein